MRVKIRAKDCRFSLPIPTAMIGFVVRWIPDSVFNALRENTPEPYRALVTKENVRMLLTACLDVLRENKGLEIIHVEAADGTFVSIKL